VIKCKICGESFYSLTFHIRAKHSISVSAYKRRFPEAKIVSTHKRRSKKKKRRSRKPKHHKGYLTTVKAGKVLYKSLWEKTVVEFLEWNDEVDSFTLEGEKLDFTTKTGAKRKTLVDFIVTLNNGNRVMIDVKPLSLLTYGPNKEKAISYKAFCKKENVQYFLYYKNDVQLLEQCVESAIKGELYL
jgi:hypothetical protein